MHALTYMRSVHWSSMNAPYSVIFCGTPEFAVPSLQRLHEDGDYDVRLAITQPDRPVGRKGIVVPTPVKAYATEHDIPVWQPEKLNKEFDHIPEKDCDYLVVVAYGQIIARRVLDMPRIMPVNVHASVLPRWRGAAPIQHAIMHGDDETGVTVQRMVKELDAGPILSTETIAIDDTTTAPRLHDALSQLGASLLASTLIQPIVETPQDDAQVTFCSKLSREDGKVSPDDMTAEEIDRHVRALVPWPGVTMELDGSPVKILSVSLHATDDSVPVHCKDDTVLHVRKLQVPGRTPVKGTEWARASRAS